MKRILLAAALFSAAVTYVASARAANPVLRLSLGKQSPGVAVLQEYLRLNRRYNFYRSSTFDGVFGPATLAGLRAWQAASEYQPTGWIVIGSGQWNQLRSEVMQPRLPAGIDIRAIAGARQDGWAIDASKRTHMLYVLRYSRYKHSFSAPLSTPTSFGGCNPDGCYVTPNGAMPVCRKAGAGEVSHVYHNAPMPFSLYLQYGGKPCDQSGLAVHYDPLGNSHECVHIPSWSLAEYLYQNFPLGALVVVHG